MTNTNNGINFYNINDTREESVTINQMLIGAWLTLMLSLGNIAH